MLYKSVVAIVLGLPAAVAVVSLITFLGPGSLQARTLPSLLLLYPTWVAVICGAFFCNDGKQAAQWLAPISICGFLALYLLKKFAWVELP